MKNISESVEKSRDFKNKNFWRGINFNGNRYLLSRYGDMLRIKTDAFGDTYRLVSWFKDPRAYVTTRITAGGKYKNLLQHRLLWVVWVGPIEDGIWINHIDGNKHNNSLENLEATTPRENHLHASRVLKRNYAKGIKSGSAEITEKQVEGIRWMLENNIPQSRIAIVAGVSQVTIHNIASGKTWKHVQ